MKYTNKELNFIADRLEKNMYELTEWEKNFCASVFPTIRADKPLSSKQAECLSKIWDRLSDV